MAHRIRVTHLLLAGGLLLAASPAFAQEGVLFQNLMKGVIGGGAEDDIEYRQRPPLVVPPGSALPRPQEPVEHAQRRLAERSRCRALAARTQAASRVPQFNPELAQQSPPVSQEELRRGRTDRGEQAPVVAEDHNNYNNQIAPIRIGRDVAAPPQPGRRRCARLWLRAAAPPADRAAGRLSPPGRHRRARPGPERSGRGQAGRRPARIRDRPDSAVMQ